MSLKRFFLSSFVRPSVPFRFLVHRIWLVAIRPNPSLAQPRLQSTLSVCFNDHQPASQPSLLVLLEQSEIFSIGNHFQLLLLSRKEKNKVVCLFSCLTFFFFIRILWVILFYFGKKNEYIELNEIKKNNRYITLLKVELEAPRVADPSSLATNTGYYLYIFYSRKL